jgi:hypothetical protein
VSARRRPAPSRPRGLLPDRRPRSCAARPRPRTTVGS